MELMDGAPPGSVYACNTSGWMNLEVFTQWFEHFLAHTKPSADDPVLLILDGHLSHTKNLDVILKARQNNVVILCLPPHCTHKLQPLDVGVMYPLSVYHNQALEKWMNNNPGRVVTTFQISKIFGESYLRAAVPLNAINGFAKCGIFPHNPDIFTDIDFVAAESTDNQQPVEMEISSNTTQSTQATTTQVSCQGAPSCSSENEINLPLSSFAVTPSKQSTKPFVNVMPSDVHPLPKMKGVRNQSRKSRGHTSILTSTPYKNQLEDEKNKKIDLEQRKALREKKKGTVSVKGKGKGKGLSNRLGNKAKNVQQNQMSESSSDEDAECLFCNEKYLSNTRGEGWIRCCVCLKWGHDDCAGVDSNDVEEFTCDFCIENRFDAARKRLNL